jgi:hypothetical protein
MEWHRAVQETGGAVEQQSVGAVKLLCLAPSQMQHMSLAPLGQVALSVSFSIGNFSTTCLEQMWPLFHDLSPMTVSANLRKQLLLGGTNCSFNISSLKNILKTKTFWKICLPACHMLPSRNKLCSNCCYGSHGGAVQGTSWEICMAFP